MKKFSAALQQNLIAPVSLIYFCGERMIQDVGESNLDGMLGRLEKVEWACRDIRDHLARARYT